jgi:hypothetical protein
MLLHSLDMHAYLLCVIADSTAVKLDVFVSHDQLYHEQHVLSQHWCKVWVTSVVALVVG